MNRERSRLVVVAVALLLAAATLSGAALAAPPAPAGAARGPLAHTFSIVARDPSTGELGVAVQSHWFQVGTAVPWAEAGVGAVATQSFVEMSYGPKGLELMRQGASAEEALKQLTAADPQRDVRQVAMVDAQGRVAAWTGKKDIAYAGHHLGEGYSVQANLMASDTVWPAMARAYEAALKDPSLSFADRLLAALDAAQGEGGDIRGRQSAALVIVRAKPSGEPWHDRLVDLRVDDSQHPLAELRRLLRLHRAYDEMNAGDEAVAGGDVDAASKHYTRATEIAPEITELPFWKAVTLYSAGKKAEALPIFKQVFQREDRWARLVPRLPASGLLPDDDADIRQILAQAPPGATEKGEAKPAAQPAGETPPPFLPPNFHRPSMHDRPAAAGSEEAKTVRIEGKLTDEGVECPAMRDEEGKLYTLTGDLRGFKPGDRVVVHGTVAEMSHCMQGTTISVSKIEKRR